MVAISTAWSGYQAARWDGHSAESYAEASRLRTEASRVALRGGQQRLYDVTTFDSWLLATTSGDEEAAALFERRFSDDYQVAFQAWLQTDPFNDPDAPPGPMYMSEYHNTLEEEAAKLDDQATVAFDEGVDSRETGDKYVRVTVFLATVLFIIAVSQRFKIMGVRLSLLGVGVVFLAFAVYQVLSYPHI